MSYNFKYFIYSSLKSKILVNKLLDKKIVKDMKVNFEMTTKQKAILGFL
jgi:hypothetical protein